MSDFWLGYLFGVGVMVLLVLSVEIWEKIRSLRRLKNVRRFNHR